MVQEDGTSEMVILVHDDSGVVIGELTMVAATPSALCPTMYNTISLMTSIKSRGTGVVMAGASVLRLSLELPTSFSFVTLSPNLC